MCIAWYKKHMRTLALIFVLACGDNIRPYTPVDASPDAKRYGPNCGGDPCPPGYVPEDAQSGYSDASIGYDAGIDACEGDPQPDHGHEPPHAHHCDEDMCRP